MRGNSTLISLIGNQTTLAAGTAGVYVAYEPAHIVLSVPPGGESYSLSFLDARDENMTVKSEVKL